MAVTTPSYKAAYPNTKDLAELAHSMAGAQTVALYGRLGEPGTLGQFFGWETAALTLLLGSAFQILLAAAVTGKEEESGITDTILTAGVSRRASASASAVLVTAASTILAGFAGVILAVESPAYEGLSLRGALCFALVVAAATWTFGALTQLIGAATGSARSARRLGFLALALAFAVRALASVKEIGWLSWLSPLGWKDAAAPFTRDLVWQPALLLAVPVVLTALAVARQTRRESGLSAQHHAKVGRTGRLFRARVHSPIGWLLHRHRGALLTWVVVVGLLGFFFGTLGPSLQQTLAQGSSTRQLLEQMTALGGATPLVLFIKLFGTMLGLLIMIHGMMIVLGRARDEAQGRAATELTTGVSTSTALLSSVATAVIHTVLLTVLAVVTVALGTLATAHPEDLDGTDVWASTARCVGLTLPGVWCALGLAALVVALIPRFAWLGWAIPAASGALSMYGGLLKLPSWVMGMSLLEHVPATSSDRWWPLMVFVAVGALAGALSAVAIRRRDVLTG